MRYKASEWLEPCTFLRGESLRKGRENYSTMIAGQEKRPIYPGCRFLTVLYKSTPIDDLNDCGNCRKTMRTWWTRYARTSCVPMPPYEGTMFDQPCLNQFESADYNRAEMFQICLTNNWNEHCKPISRKATNVSSKNNASYASDVTLLEILSIPMVNTYTKYKPIKQR